MKPSVCSRPMTLFQLEASAQAPCSSTMTGLGPPPQRKWCELPVWAEAAWLVAAKAPAATRAATKMVRRSLVSRFTGARFMAHSLLGWRGLNCAGVSSPETRAGWIDDVRVGADVLCCGRLRL